MKAKSSISTLEDDSDSSSLESIFDVSTLGESRDSNGETNYDRLVNSIKTDNPLEVYKVIDDMHDFEVKMILSMRDSCGMTPLHTALSKGNLEICKLLVEESPLEVMSMTVKCEFLIEKSSSEFPLTTLNETKNLLYKSKGEATALTMGIFSLPEDEPETFEIIKLIFNKTDQSSRSVTNIELMQAISRYDVKVVEWLLDKMTPDNLLAIDPYFGSIMHFIVYTPRIENIPEKIKLLLNKEPQLINFENTEGNTPLYEATKNESPSLVKYLLIAGANPYKTDFKNIGHIEKHKISKEYVQAAVSADKVYNKEEVNTTIRENSYDIFCSRLISNIMSKGQIKDCADIKSHLENYHEFLPARLISDFMNKLMDVYINHAYGTTTIEGHHLPENLALTEEFSSFFSQSEVLNNDEPLKLEFTGETLALDGHPHA